MMANQQSQQRQQEPQETPGQAALRIATALVIILLGIALFIALIGAIIGGWSFIEHAGIWLVLAVLVVGGVTWQFPRINTHLATTKREDKLNDAQVKFLEAKAYRLTRILPMSDDQGNALINDPETHIVGAYRGQMREFTALTSLHNTQKYTGVQGETPPAQLPAGNIQRISIDDATRHITQQLESCLGSSLRNNGAPILGDWSESHILIIGSTRMGKSCEAGNILRQAEKTHSPEHLQIAMLDAEYKTSRLFEHSPLLLKLDVKGRRIVLHAKNLEEVPAVLHLLALEAERRDRLEEWELAELPHILAYFEEFLNTKKQIKARFPKQFDTFLTDFNMLTTRGVKLGIHLMLCAQVNYADEDLRDSMAQFSGLNISFCVNPTAARSAGFVETDLLNENYRAKQRGQFVVESMSGNDIGLAPDFDVKERIKLTFT